MTTEAYINGFIKKASEYGFTEGEALELLKEAEKPGLWANIRAKRARGEKPAKPGSEDYPDKKQWDKLTKAAVAAWQRSEGKNPEGGLNAKGRASYKRETGGTLKAPVTESKPTGERAKRRHSFCSRMCGMKRVNTGSKAKSDPDSRINKSLRKWNCKCGEAHDSLYEKVACFTKQTKIAVNNFEPREMHEGTLGDMAGSMVFGNNYIPRPLAGEDMADAFDRLKRHNSRMQMGGQMVAAHPIMERLGLSQTAVPGILGKAMIASKRVGNFLSPLLGNVGSATKDLSDMLNNPSVMSQFKR